jgi:AcrR family transcriptional regulator
VPRKKERTDELRNHILHIAQTILEREGVSGFTTRRIAQGAGTSVPAVYELFGDKAGVLREVFFEGFQMLRKRYGLLQESDDPRADLVDVLYTIRSFVQAHPVLANLMFSQTFSSFNPGPIELKAGNSVRSFLVKRVRRCLESGILVGNETDIAHVLLALTQGLCAQEQAGWLGTSKASINRRWQLAIHATLNGLGSTDSVPDTMGNS